MPGLLGHKANWIKFARSLTQRNPSLKLLLVDLRNHGDTTQLQVAFISNLSDCSRRQTMMSVRILLKNVAKIL